LVSELQCSGHQVSNLRGAITHLARRQAFDFLACHFDDRGLDSFGSVGFTEKVEQHLPGADGGQRIDHALPRVLGRAAADGLEHAAPVGLILPPAAIPIPPWIIAPRSVMMSPNMLSVTMTS